MRDSGGDENQADIVNGLFFFESEI
jgi:hypothetical protein